MNHLSAPVAILVIAGAAGCADPSRVDVLEAKLARVRAEGELRDRKIAWLYWSHTNLAARAASPSAADEREALAKRIAALEAENAALLQRLARARRPEAPGGDVPPPPAPAHPAPTRTLDEQVPYELAVHRPDGGLPAPPDDHAPPARRTLDERVPY